MSCPKKLSLVVVLLLLSGCQQHVVDAYKRCEEVTGQKCVVVAVPESVSGACGELARGEMK